MTLIKSTCYSVEVVNQIDNSIMSQIEVVAPIEHDGIEFYVSSDGKESGMSVRGLSRFIGIDHKTLTKLLTTKLETVGDTKLCELLKPFVGKAFAENLVGDNFGTSAKIIPAKTCEAIIFYYAFESKRLSEEVKQNATNAYRKFAQYGLHQWICNAVGVIEKKDDNELLNLVKEVLVEVKELRQVATEYKVIREKTITYLPGADDLLDELKEGKCLPSIDGSTSLEGWLFEKGVQLSEKQFRRLAHIVCDTYRSLTKRDPEKAHCKVNGKVKYNVSVFKPEHYAILQIGLNKLLA